MKNQKEVINNFLYTLKRRFDKGKITYFYDNCGIVDCQSTDINLQKLNHLTIKKNNNSITFCIRNIDSRYLQLAQIGNVIISFDKGIINEAGEWDIINQNSSFLITKTLSSFLNNKVWAWIERSREIWKEEFGQS